jgi:hypothetical protein
MMRERGTGRGREGMREREREINFPVHCGGQNTYSGFSEYILKY